MLAEMRLGYADGPQWKELTDRRLICIHGARPIPRNCLLADRSANPPRVLLARGTVLMSRIVRSFGPPCRAIDPSHAERESSRHPASIKPGTGAKRDSTRGIAAAFAKRKYLATNDQSYRL